MSKIKIVLKVIITFRFHPTLYLTDGAETQKCSNDRIIKYNSNNQNTSIIIFVYMYVLNVLASLPLSDGFSMYVYDNNYTLLCAFALLCNIKYSKRIESKAHINVNQCKNQHNP